MTLFRRKKRHAAAEPVEEAAEMREVSGTTVFGPGAISAVQPAGSGGFGFIRNRNTAIGADQLRVSADQKDDVARSQLIEDERRREYGV